MKLIKWYDFVSKFCMRKLWNLRDNNLFNLYCFYSSEASIVPLKL